MSDLSCLTVKEEDSPKTAHYHRLTAAATGDLSGHLTRKGCRVPHDGAVDAALIAAWAAGARGPGRTSPRWFLDVAGQSVAIDHPDGTREPTGVRRASPTKTMLAHLAARGRWAQARGSTESTQTAADWVRSIGPEAEEVARLWRVAFPLHATKGAAP